MQLKKMIYWIFLFYVLVSFIMNTPHNIYIHVPFCISKCNYCAFFSSAIAPDWDCYTNGICTEIDFWAQHLGCIKIPTVFFGGGTPSLMPIRTFETIMNHLRKNFDMTKCTEITLESNPGTLDKHKLDDFISCGINRLSIGVQSFDDNELKFLGRRHDAKTALSLIEQAHKTGIRVSCDFIYGLPNQNVKNIIALCNKINQIGLKHASLYELTIEKNTPFGRMNLQMPTNNEMADMYLAITDKLWLPRYEVSNYAAPENVCQHNQNVWDGDAYIGLGRGAAGRVFMNDSWFEQYGGDIKYSQISNLTRATERIITGLRTTRGVYLDTDVKNIIDMDFINAHNDLVFIKNNRLVATNNGVMTLDGLLTNIIR